MFQRNTNLSTSHRAHRSGVEGVPQLLRRPLVLALLLMSAGVQVAAVWSRHDTSDDVARLAPVTVEPEEPTVSELWARQATEREARRIAQKYRMEGFALSNDLVSSITEAALKHDIDIDLAFGLVRAESSFRTSATSPVGAVGLTQLMPSTARWLKPGVSRSALRDPKTNLDLGFRYLRYLLERYDGNVKLALLAYNRGPGTVDRALKRGRDPDNGYAAFVQGKKNHGHKLFTE